MGNIDPPTFPDGLDIEVVLTSALLTAAAKATTIYDREHVTPYLRTNSDFVREKVICEHNYSFLRWTLGLLVYTALIW